MSSLLENIQWPPKVNFDDAYNAFLGMDRRLQLLLVLFLVLFFIFGLIWPIGYLSSQLDAKEDEYIEYLQTASEIQGAVMDYSQMQQSVKSLKKGLSTLGSDPLKSLVYNIAEEQNIPISQVEVKTVNTPGSGDLKEISKEVTLKNANYDKVVQFLDRLTHYRGVPIKIRKLSIRPDRNKRELMRQTQFTIVTIGN
jgi:hypothetical protein